MHHSTLTCSGFLPHASTHARKHARTQARAHTHRLTDTLTHTNAFRPSAHV